MSRTGQDTCATHQYCAVSRVRRREDTANVPIGAHLGMHMTDVEEEAGQQIKGRPRQGMELGVQVALHERGNSGILFDAMHCRPDRMPSSCSLQNKASLIASISSTHEIVGFQIGDLLHLN